MLLRSEYSNNVEISMKKGLKCHTKVSIFTSKTSLQNKYDLQSLFKRYDLEMPSVHFDMFT